MKSLWKRDWFRITLIVTVIVTACGVVTVPVTYLMFLPMMGFAGGNSCPAWLPFTVEDWGRFRLPPSFRNLESYCAGMQGWIARAQFDISPSDVDVLIDGTHIIKPLMDKLGPDSLYYDNPQIQQMESYLFGQAKNGWQTVLIDTSDPTVYHVYFSAVGGN